MIRAEGLWMLFGEQAEQRLRASEGGGQSAADRARLLRGQGVIAAVAGVDFTVNAGELFVIMGLSGSGKSTLIRCLARLIEPTAGRVWLDGEDILAASNARLTALRRTRLGMVFQHFGLFPHLTVLDNVAFPLKVQGIARAARLARAREMIALVGLEGRERAFPRELSGGQRQRVGIARSLVGDPQLWFLDEPFSALDPLIRRQLQDEFLRLQASLRKTILFITHDINEAVRLADRIAIMRDGAIVQVGTPGEIVLHPVDDYVADFSRDVPRGQVMRLADLAGSTANSGSDAGPAGLHLPASLTLDQALAACVNHWDAGPGARITLCDARGQPVGQISSAEIARALAPAGQGSAAPA